MKIPERTWIDEYEVILNRYEALDQLVIFAIADGLYPEPADLGRITPDGMPASLSRAVFEWASSNKGDAIRWLERE